MKAWRFLLLAFLLSLVARTAWMVYDDIGLFTRLGWDYSLFVTQATVARLDGISSIYDFSVGEKRWQTMVQDSPDPEKQLTGYIAPPYLPIFAWMMIPLTMVTPQSSFLMWSMINLMGAGWLAWRAMQFWTIEERPIVGLLVLASYPIVLTLFLGQNQILLACAVAEAFVALRQERDFSAGVWLGLLLIKPHYLMLFVLLLLWKRRWYALAGMSVVGTVIVSGSILVGGIEAVRAYHLGDKTLFRGDWPAAMINWRALILLMRPGSGERFGMTGTLILGLLTVASVAVVFRGPWHPRTDRYFASKLTLLLIGTLIANFHSHAYGAALLAVPLAACLMEQQHPLARMIVIVGAILPTIIFTVGYPPSITHADIHLRYVWGAKLTLASLLACFSIVWVQLLLEGLSSMPNKAFRSLSRK
jgi:hypothetical protein